MVRKIKNFYKTMRRPKIRPQVDPNGFLARIVRLVAAAAVMAAFLSGARAEPKIPDLSEGQLTTALEKQGGGLRAFVTALEKSMAAGNLEAAEALVDRDSLLGRATASLGIKDEDALRGVFCDSTRRAWDERGVLRDYANARFRFLRVRSLGGRAGLLFRSSSRENGMNYALITLNEPAPGDYRISDVFVVGLNEYLSSTLRRTYINVCAGFLNGDASQLPGVNRGYVEHINQVAAISRELQNGGYEKVLLQIKELPEAVQRERSVLLMRLEAAEHVSVEERDASYTAWLAAYPDEMELPLKFADFYVTHRRWDDAERVLRGLITRLGPDALIKMELGTVLFRRKHDALWTGAEAQLSAR
jgi:hypothetical protein